MFSPEVFDKVLAQPDWMRQNYTDIKWRTLRQICLPFSHDAGMSSIKLSQPVVPDQHVLTQRLDVGGQLNAGARVFDIRPVAHPTSNGWEYYTSHGGYQALANMKWVGGGGQSLKEICNQINSFTSQHSELIILEINNAIYGDITHVFDTDPRDGVTFTSINNMTQSHYNDLFQYLSEQLGDKLYSCPDPHADLTTLPMSDFLGAGKAAVIITLSDSGFTIPPEFLGKGFYYGRLTTDAGPMKAAAADGRRSQLHYNGEYSNSNDPNFVESDQLWRLAKYHKDDSFPPFLLWWTATEQFSFSWGFARGSIKDGADKMNSKLQDLRGKVTRENYPSMIAVDFFTGSVTRLAIDINMTLARPTTDKWQYEVLDAFWGPGDVTAGIRASFAAWRAEDNATSNPHSTGPYRFKVTPGRPELGLDPVPNVPKQLVVLMRRYHVSDDCLSYIVQYSANDFEELVIDTAEMTLSKSYAQREQTMSNLVKSGEADVGVAYAMYGPIDPSGVAILGMWGLPIKPIRCVDEVLKALGPEPFRLENRYQTQFTVNFQGTLDAHYQGQLRVMMYKRSKTQTKDCNRANTTTYRLFTALEGEAMTLDGSW